MINISPELSQADSRYYGRRGRPLSTRAKTRHDALTPKLTLPEHTPIADLASLFGTAKTNIGLEIGFGNGERLATMLRNTPDLAWIGIDPYKRGQAKLLSLVERDQNLSRLRIARHTASILPYLPAESLTRIDVLFPDPWPKRRHWSRRVIQTDTSLHFARLLIPGGKLLITTDSDTYGAWIAAKLASVWSWDPRRWSIAPNDWVTTAYQRKAVACGRPTIYFDLQKP